MKGQSAGRAVVVGIDGSDRALDAVRWAAREAARRTVPLRMVTALVWSQDHALGQVGLGARYRDIMLDAAHRQLSDAVAAAEKAVAGVEIESQLIVGYPIPVLQDESRRSQLVVLGDRGYGGVSGLLLGSVATALATTAACPVVLVRGGAADVGERVGDPSRPVVVGVDGSPVSESALAFAFEAAGFRGVPLIAVHTWWDLLVDPAVTPLAWEAIEADKSQFLAERLAGWAGKYPDVRVERLITRDRPAHALLEQSRHAQLVVVGSRGRGTASRLLLGSVSNAVLHKAHCSVAVVRPPDETGP